MEQCDSPVESHPLEPFLPEGARLLMLGSFPPKKERWSMDFFYPNFINDMWRIVGLVFLGDRNYFVSSEGKSFDKDKVVRFCMEKGIALYDTACQVRRLKDNASDKFLEVVTPTDIKGLLGRIPECGAIVVTGQKAAETIASLFSCDVPSVGESSVFECGGRKLRLWRMPSSSRAYPLALEKKAAFYRNMFKNMGFVPFGE